MLGDISSQGSIHRHSTSNLIVRWNAPPLGVVKINFDGSLSQNSTAGGFIIRDWTGKVIKAGAAHYREPSILVAEARTLRDEVKAVANARFKRVLIEGDHATVNRTLRGEASSPWQIAAIIQDVNKYLRTMIYVSISHVYREANMATDWLSKKGQTVLNVAVSWATTPPWELMAADKIGRTLVRRDI